MRPASFGMRGCDHRLDAIESQCHNFPFCFGKAPTARRHISLGQRPRNVDIYKSSAEGATHSPVYAFIRRDRFRRHVR